MPTYRIDYRREETIVLLVEATTAEEAERVVDEMTDDQISAAMLTSYDTYCGVEDIRAATFERA
jgi:hypothetical protein